MNRRAMLQMTTGAALAAPIALMPAGAVAADAAAPDRTPAPEIPAGPVRRLEGVLSLIDTSVAPSPFRERTAAEITLDIVADGRGVLTLSHPDRTPDQVVLLPADVARELDRVLFHVEGESERRIREKRAAGYVDCTFCDRGRLFRDCPVCDDDHLARPSAIAGFRFPWLTAAEVAPHLGRLPRSWRATVSAVAEGTPGWRRQFRPETIGTIEQVRVRCVEIELPGAGSADPATIYLRRGEAGGVTWWTAVGEHHDMQNPEVATIPEALVLAAASTRQGIAAMADPALLTAWLGPWVTVEEVAALVPLVPAAWLPTVTGWPEYSEARRAQFRGTTEEGRLNTVTIDLPGLGPQDTDGFGPGVCLNRSERRDGRFHWSASLPDKLGAPDPGMGHGDTDTLREAVVAGIASIERRLGGLALAA